jgi:hypothetical protein
MNGLRYHGLALVTSVVTLGVGVVLGVGPITEAQSQTHQRESQQLRDRQARLERRATAATTAARGDQALAESLAAPLTRHRLDGHTVVVIAAPGADRSLVRRTSTVVATAGATVTGTLTLRPDYVDPTKAQSPLEDLALRLVPPGVTFAEGASPIARVGTVLARSTVTRDVSTAGDVDQKAAELIAGLDELNALTLVGDPGRLADLAVVVAGPPPRGKAAASAARDALLGLVTALDGSSRGTVVLGAAQPHGLVAEVRAGQQRSRASTVDTAGSVAGDLAVVLGLAEQAAGRSGDYGSAAGADALVPAVAPAASRG